MLSELSTHKPSQSRRRFFIDCTHTTLSGYQTGVQRVVRKICEHAPDAAFGTYDDVVPVMLGKNGFQRYHQRADALCETGNGQSIDDGIGLAPKRNLRRRIARSVQKVVRTTSCWFGTRSTGMSQPVPIDRERATIQFVESDTLLLPDAYWALPTIWPWVQLARQAGVRTAIVIYDLIPHTHSNLYSSEGAEGFRRYLRAACEHADCLVAISNTVRNQLLDQLPLIIGRNVLPFSVEAFQLGAEFSESAGPVRPEVLDVFDCSQRELPYLMVGTIEIRKNHQYTLDAMEKLWTRYPNRRLCVVGRPGWKGEPIVDRILKHARYGKQLFWFNNATDSDLQHCYRHAFGVVFPSITEGFGLPIVESLWFGRDTFASDTPIHREVGGDRCRYFSLEQNESLLKYLILKEAAPKSSSIERRIEEKSNNDSLLTWSQSVCELIGVIDHSLCNVKHSASVPRLYRRSA